MRGLLPSFLEIIMGIFDGILDAVDNVLDIGSNLIYGELPSKSQVIQLISDGVTIAAIASQVGCSEEDIQNIIE